jgi:cation transport protein ChaC
MNPTPALPRPLRDPAPMLAAALHQWGGHEDLWIFGYASLIWRPDFAFEERRPAQVRGWHRALKMWSRVNRGTPEVPGLVFALLPGGSCHGVAFRVHRQQAPDILATLWEREMPTGVYDPRWLRCGTPHGPVSALAFTLSRHSPNYTGALSGEQYRHIFAHARGRYGSTHDYAHLTYESLKAHGIHDRALEQLLRHAR